ncbi:DMT family transporter [Pseudomarimonas arenosa]|uniref:DMT family transporter n=1 Tax=Pseudomarimonas arenosa TaxID=2774145 RepID=A0AAW3ZWF7_9GAMM|nr:DMT family transporter [Pseudomarimonas arenosa]MBD8528341.1 DMT family transporter [Pseudomarimonas arenosa]
MPAPPAPRSAYLQIHLCVVLWGFTAILGKLIVLAALPLVWWRMLIVTLVLLCIPRVRRALTELDARSLLAFAGVGALVALHWLTFYASIKLSNASIAATCIALGPVFLSVLEPAMHRRMPDWRDLAIGIGVVPGVALVVGATPGDMWFGMLIGVLSAFLVAVFGSLNKHLVHRTDALTVTALELGAGVLCLTLISPWVDLLIPGQGGTPWTLPSPADWAWLLTLALACTLFPFALSLHALRHLSAFSAQLAVNLEPIYAMLLAGILFSEQQQLTQSFYLGAAIVIAGVFLHPLLHRTGKRAETSNVGVAESKSVER